MIKLPEHLSYDKETTAKLRTQKIFRYGDVKRFDDELDFLMGFVPDLKKDFLTEYKDIEDCLQKGTTSALESIYSQLKRSNQGNPEKHVRAKAMIGMENNYLKGQTTRGKYNNDACRVLVMKYHNPNIVGAGANQHVQQRMLNIKQKQDGYNPDAFPTMAKIAQHYGEKCPILEYSILPAQSIIERHTVSYTHLTLPTKA